MAKQGVSPLVTSRSVVSLPRRTVHTVRALEQQGLLAGQQPAAFDALAERYAIAITPEMVDQMDKSQLATDPIARQFVPDLRELQTTDAEKMDPIGDYAHAPLKALVHRHANRVLLKPTLACAVYCRFCFRREMVGPNGDSITQSDVDAALDYIGNHDGIREVILTGGDPLIMAPARLHKMMQRLQAMPHIQWVRIHTRVPVVQPGKITPAMLEALQCGDKPVTIVLHVNHAREMTPAAIQACRDLHANGHMLLSQSVLLRDINNNVTALAELFETLLRHRVKPYYLHHPDLAPGTSHFRLSLDDGMQLMQQLRACVSGLAMPNYVIDIPGGVTKVPVNSDHVQPVPEQPGAYWLIAPDGQKYFYRDDAVGC